MIVNRILSCACSKIISKNIPEYLYHLTGKINYEGIMRDGFIEKSGDFILNKGAVFTIERDNYLKQWSKTTVNNDTLKNMLLDQAASRGEVLALRIPTKNLKLKNLFVRNQNKFFGIKEKFFGKLSKNPVKCMKFLADLLHVRYGTPACLSKFYGKNKAYEYIYKNRISTDKIDCVIPLEEFLKGSG